LDNAIDLYEQADHLIIDELKVNCLKFISLNLISFLESTYLDRLLSLPIYLIRDLENFIKIHDYYKYQLFSMHVIEDVEGWFRAHTAQETEDAKQSSNPSSLNHDYCSALYDSLMEKY
jgi:hypothetical protein